MLLGARPRSGTNGQAFDLLVASVTGAWERFATVTLAADPAGAEDAPVDFDPVRNPLPGLSLAAFFAALREPAYAAARRHRPDTVDALPGTSQVPLSTPQAVGGSKQP